MTNKEIERLIVKTKKKVKAMPIIIKKTESELEEEFQDKCNQLDAQERQEIEDYEKYYQV